MINSPEWVSINDGIDTYKNRLKEYLAEVLPLDTWERACTFFDNMSDEDFTQFCLELRSKDDFSARDYYNNTREVMKRLGVTTQTNAAANMPRKLLSEDQNNFCKQQISKSNPSDLIYLSRQEDLFLIDLWEPSDRKNITIPSDLFFAKTIPLRDCVITVDETHEPNGMICKYRVIIFDGYDALVDRAIAEKSDSPIIVGAVIQYQGNEMTPFYLPITIVRGVDFCLGNGTGWLKESAKQKAEEIFTNSFASAMMISFLETWYGIQIALLHPAVKDVFSNPQRTVLENNNTAHKKKKRKAKYIKKHYLTLENLESVSQSKDQRKINRKCLAWYVIGHWRTYKNGNKVFIMPYWKGALRDLKKNSAGDDREREIHLIKFQESETDQEET